MTVFSVDSAIPGGNAAIISVIGDEIRLRPDLRDTTEPWFWWHLRVRGAGGRRLEFRFTVDFVLGSRGPAASFDGGTTWRWLEHVERRQGGFVLPVPEGCADLRLAMAIPYTGVDLESFCAAHPQLRREVLATTRRGRAVPLLRCGGGEGASRHRVLVTARHHACECSASWAVEGLLSAFLAEDDLGRRLRRSVEVLCVPCVDLDGVVDGDQGKCRAPHDHNRDYEQDPVHPEVAAIRAHAQEWIAGGLQLHLDLHAPWIHGVWNEHIYAVGCEQPEVAVEQRRFCRALEQVASGPLPYRADEGYLPFGTAWNTYGGQPRTSTGWFSTQGVTGISFEIPYANVRLPGQVLSQGRIPGTAVTPASARAFGRDLAAAIDAFVAPTSVGTAGGLQSAVH